VVLRDFSPEVAQRSLRRTRPVLFIFCGIKHPLWCFPRGAQAVPSPNQSVFYKRSSIYLGSSLTSVRGYKVISWGFLD